MRASLGDNAALLYELVPELEVLLGPSSALPSVGPGEAREGRVEVGEIDPLPRYAVDVRRFVAHGATIVVADVVPADIVAPYDEDIWFFFRNSCLLGR